MLADFHICISVPCKEHKRVFLPTRKALALCKLSFFFQFQPSRHYKMYCKLSESDDHHQCKIQSVAHI